MYIGKIWAWFLSALMGYLLGSLNGSLIVSELFYKDDIRHYGSKNAGAANIMRTYGVGKAVLTLIIDFGKTILGILIGRYFIGDYAVLVCGVAVTLGHAFPVFFHFKGGKAAACSAACILMMDWRAFIVAAVTFFFIALFTRIVSVATLTVACTLPLNIWLWCRSLIGTSAFSIRMTLSIYICIFIIILHRENIKRLMTGSENRISWKGHGKK